MWKRFGLAPFFQRWRSLARGEESFLPGAWKESEHSSPPCPRLRFPCFRLPAVSSNPKTLYKKFQKCTIQLLRMPIHWHCLLLTPCRQHRHGSVIHGSPKTDDPPSDVWSEGQKQPTLCHDAWVIHLTSFHHVGKKFNEPMRNVNKSIIRHLLYKMV